MRANLKLALAGLIGLAVGAAGMEGLHAQQAGAIKRTVLQTVDLAGIPNKHAVLGIAEIPSGMMAGHHFHHGQELGYVLAGNLELMVDGQPVQALKAGDSFSIPLEKPHDAKVVGDGPAKVIGVYIVDADKPLAEPVK